VLRETDPQTTIWELLLPEEAKRLPAELVQIDAYLDDERFLAPWRALFDRRLGRPSVPVDTLLRLLYLKHRYQLGYESLCREVADSISWRRFCRIGLDRPAPHPTTLVKLVRRAGPEVIGQLNTALVAKLATDRLLRARKLRWTPPWSRPTSTTRPTRICWSRPCASSVGWSGASRPAVRPVGLGSVTVAAPPGGG
jgi:transposase, IS5 family